MASDSDNDDFDEDYSMIDQQIALFECRQSIKTRKTKQKVRKPKCPITARTLKASPKLIKSKCMSYNQTPKAEPKTFRYVRYFKESAVFECDREFPVIEQEPIPNTELKLEKTPAKKLKQNNSSRFRHRFNPSKKLDVEHLVSFSSFRQHFYNLTHNLIKSSLQNQPFIKIADIRPAFVSETVQEYFMKTLQTYPYFPQLVYHGTHVNNIKNILTYGLLIPDQSRRSISGTPRIASRSGQVCGSGIYCSLTVSHSVSFTNETNTILVCAALPKRHGPYAIMDHFFGNILILRQESRIIPLFLFDFKYLNGPERNCPWFDYEKKVPLKEKKQISTNVPISRKYLRKILARMNDETRKVDPYQIRQYESVH